MAQDAPARVQFVPHSVGFYHTDASLNEVRRALGPDKSLRPVDWAGNVFSDHTLAEIFVRVEHTTYALLRCGDGFDLVPRKDSAPPMRVPNPLVTAF